MIQDRIFKSIFADDRLAQKPSLVIDREVFCHLPLRPPLGPFPRLNSFWFLRLDFCSDFFVESTLKSINLGIECVKCLLKFSSQRFSFVGRRFDGFISGSIDSDFCIEVVVWTIVRVVSLFVRSVFRNLILTIDFFMFDVSDRLL